jgi:hypothetical protein
MEGLTIFGPKCNTKCNNGWTYWVSGVFSFSFSLSLPSPSLLVTSRFLLSSSHPPFVFFLSFSCSFFFFFFHLQTHAHINFFLEQSKKYCEYKIAETARLERERQERIREEQLAKEEAARRPVSTPPPTASFADMLDRVPPNSGRALGQPGMRATTAVGNAPGQIKQESLFDLQRFLFLFLFLFLLLFLFLFLFLFPFSPHPLYCPFAERLNK